MIKYYIDAYKDYWIISEYFTIILSLFAMFIVFIILPGVRVFIGQDFLIIRVIHYF